MKIETIEERIAKNEEKIAKKTNTIAKKTKAIEKKKNEIKKAYNFEFVYGTSIDSIMADGFTSEEAGKIYWMGCDIYWLEDDVRRLGKEIEEIKKANEKYAQMKIVELAKEDVISEMPEIFTTLRDELTKTWDNFDYNRQKFLQSECSSMGYSEFVKKYKYSAYDFAWNTTAEKIHSDNEKAARELILDMVNRVKRVTGEITSWKDIQCEMGSCGMPCLTGIVEGKEGKARIETIYAGGYNIQKRHIRILVHEV